MALTCLSGNGTTITFGTSMFSGSIVNIGAFFEELPDINVSTLATTGHEEYCAGDLIEHTTIPVTIAFDPENDPTLNGTAETITITFANSATLAGTGYIKQHGFDGIANNERIEGTYTIRFDGDTGPAYANAP